MNAASASKAHIRLGLSVPAFLLLSSLILFSTFTAAQIPVTTDPPSYGPYNGTFLPDGDGLHKSLVKDDSVTLADSPWSIYAWVKIAESSKAPTLIAGLGDPADEFSRYLAIENGDLTLWVGQRQQSRFDRCDFRGTMAFLGGYLRRRRVQPLQRREPSRQRQARPWQHNSRSGNRSSYFACFELETLRRCCQRTHTSPPRIDRRRTQATRAIWARFFCRPVRGRIKAVASADAGTSRIPRAARSLDDAAHQSPVFKAGCKACSHAGASPTQRRCTMDTCFWMDDAPGSEADGRRCSNFASEFQLA